MLPRTVPTWPLKKYQNGAWWGSRESVNFWTLSANSSKMVKAADFKFVQVLTRDKIDYPWFQQSAVRKSNIANSVVTWAHTQWTNTCHLAVLFGWLFAVALPFACDFETDAICDMQLSTASHLDWTRRIGRASEDNTGPPGAQSGSYYMLVDASVSIAAGHRAMWVVVTYWTRQLHHTVYSIQYTVCDKKQFPKLFHHVSNRLEFWF